MTQAQRRNGLICGGVVAVICSGVVLIEALNTGKWYIAVPICACLLWGLLSYLDLERENDRREKILTKHRIDERAEAI